MKTGANNWFTNLNGWVNENKFWAETFRTVILGVVGTFLIATTIEKIKNNTAYDSEVNKAKLAWKIDVIKSLSEKSYKFTSLVVRYREQKICKDEIRNVYDEYRLTQHQFNLILKDSKLENNSDSIARDMLRLISTKDSLSVLGFNNFEQVRNKIKNQSTILEYNALNHLEDLK